MSYASLQQAAGWLFYEKLLDPALKAEAEAYADARIDEIFAAWNRTDWAASPPSQIVEAASMLAAGRYIEIGEFGPGADPTKESRGAALIAKGMEMARAIRAEGGPWWDAARTYRQSPCSARGNPRFVQLEPS